MRLERRAREVTARHRTASWRSPVTLRLAGAADASGLERLAQLDSRPLPPGPHLVAIREERVDAAISLSTGELIADPFRRTADLCELLRCHAGPRRVERGEIAVPLADPRPALAAT
jgi:hypothetical protein